LNALLIKGKGMFSCGLSLLSCLRDQYNSLEQIYHLYPSSKLFLSLEIKLWWVAPWLDVLKMHKNGYS